MIAIRRRTRETLRHERAVVLQQRCAPTVAGVRADIVANQRKAKWLREQAQRRAGQ